MNYGVWNGIINLNTNIPTKRLRILGKLFHESFVCGPSDLDEDDQARLSNLTADNSCDAQSVAYGIVRMLCKSNSYACVILPDLEPTIMFYFHEFLREQAQKGEIPLFLCAKKVKGIFQFLKIVIPDSKPEWHLEYNF